MSRPEKGVGFEVLDWSKKAVRGSLLQVGRSRLIVEEYWELMGIHSPQSHSIPQQKELQVVKPWYDVLRQYAGGEVVR